MANLIATFISLPSYLINLIDLGFPVYPNPFSELGKKVYPQGEDIFNPHVLFHRYIRISAAFLKYDNLEISYHKGFGLIFWVLTLPAFIVFCLKNLRGTKQIVFWILSVFAPLFYLLWSVIPTIHVQARFLMWFVALTYPFISIFKIRRSIILILFLVQFATNFLKMKNQDQPFLHFSPIFNALEYPECILYDRFFIRYSKWFGYYWKVSSILQIISEVYDEELHIRCVYSSGDRMSEGSCPFLFFGPIRRWEVNDFSICTHLVDDPDIIIVMGDYNDSIEGFILVIDAKVIDPRGMLSNYKFYVRSDLYEKVKDFLAYKRRCF